MSFVFCVATISLKKIWNCPNSLIYCTTEVSTSPMVILKNHFHVGFFWVKSFFVDQDKTEFARSFFPPFFCLSAVAKSSVSILILFSTINSDIFKLNNLLGFLFFLFYSFFLFIVLLIICSSYFLLIFDDRHLYIVLFEG